MVALENGSYPCSWHNCTVSYMQNYHSAMIDFHTHSFYEVSLILTGNVRSLLSNRAEEGKQSRLVLTAPLTPHWMSLVEPCLYTRINLSFSDEFVANYVPEWHTLLKVFGEKGNIILLSDEQCEFCQKKLLTIRDETDSFRQRLQILEFLSYVADLDLQSPPSERKKCPSFFVDALTYINENYTKKIVAHDLAWRLGVGRTTLMVTFRKQTGSTLAEYVTRVRLKEAILLLQQGLSQETVAERVGLTNSAGLIRAFHRYYGMTPRQYIKQLQEKEGI